MQPFFAKYSARRAAYRQSISENRLSFRSNPVIFALSHAAGVAELADALDSKSSDRKIVWVRAPPPASPICFLLQLLSYPAVVKESILATA